MENLGELVKAWRTQSGLSAGELARMVGDDCSRQLIEQLEKTGSRMPRYIVGLARAMGTTVEELYALRMPAPLQGRPRPPSRHRVQEPSAAASAYARQAQARPTLAEWQVLEDLRVLPVAEQQALLADLHVRAEAFRAYAEEVIKRHEQEG